MAQCYGTISRESSRIISRKSLIMWILWNCLMRWLSLRIPCAALYFLSIWLSINDLGRVSNSLRTDDRFNYHTWRRERSIKVLITSVSEICFLKGYSPITLNALTGNLFLQSSSHCSVQNCILLVLPPGKYTAFYVNFYHQK